MRSSLVVSPLTRLRYRALHLSSAELPLRCRLLRAAPAVIPASNEAKALTKDNLVSARKLGLSLNLPLTQCQFLVYLMSSAVKIITINIHYFFDRKLNCVYNLTLKSLNISWLRKSILTSGFVPENGSVLTISVLFTYFENIFM